MRPLRIEDFEKLAKRIVAEHLGKNTPVIDNVVKVAEEMGLNPNQVKNLVQLANKMTHLALFERKNDGDKIIDFSPIDPDDVLRKLYPEGEPEEDVASVCEPDAVDRITDLLGDLPSSLDGTDVSETLPEENNEAADPDGTPYPTSPNRRSVLVIKIRKVAEELESKKLGAAWEYREELDKIASDFAKLNGPSYEEFEKDALAVRGRSAIPVLSDIRNCLKLPGIKTVVLEKTARVVDTDTPLMRRFDELVKLSNQYDDCEAAVAYLKKEVGNVL